MIAWLLGGELGSTGALVRTAPDAVVWAAALAAGVAWVAAWRGDRSPLARAVELGAWAMALAGLVVALARPVWVEQAGRSEPGRLVVLVDASGSMAVREGGQPRHAAVDAWLARLREEPGVEVLQFSDRLEPGAPAAFDRSGTDLAAVLGDLSDRYAGERLGGIVLLTDGLDRGPLRAAWQAGVDPEPPQLPGPLTVAAIGQAGAVKDLSVVAVDAGGYAYLRTPVTLRARLAGTGFEGGTVDVELTRDGALVERRPVTLDAEGRGEVSFDIVPTEAGRFAWSVRVPAYDGDAVPGNNELPVVLRVVRDKIRVLQVAGAPSWDVKFLRRFLKGDPSVDLVSFFILRTHEDTQTARWDEDELSLIAFPYQDLFTSELSSFDLVVFQNFDYEEFFQSRADQLLGNVRDHIVEGGRGFVMTGGDRSFDLGAYGTTPLGDILPVTVAAQEVPPDEAPFQPVLTGAGARHPVTRLVSDAAENGAWWGRLHALDGVHRGIRPAPGATVLLRHPSVTGTDGQPAPVLAVREAGRGRTLALTVDTSWRWSLSEAAEGRGNQAYLRFWKAAMRWLVKDPTAQRVSIEPERENVALGEPARLVVRVRDAAFSPVEGAEAAVDVVGDAGARSFTVLTNADGEAVIEVPSERRGAHRVRAVVGKGGTGLGEAHTVYAVTSRDPELEEVAPDPAFLQWLASRSDGVFHAAGTLGEVVRDAAADRTVWDRREVAVWRSPALMLWVALWAGLAWIVRRRAGLR